MAHWFLLDTSHADYNRVVSAMRQAHNGRGRAYFSNRTNETETQSIAKVRGAGRNDFNSGAILDIYNNNTLKRSDVYNRIGEWIETEQNKPRN